MHKKGFPHDRRVINSISGWKTITALSSFQKVHYFKNFRSISYKLFVHFIKERNGEKSTKLPFSLGTWSSKYRKSLKVLSQREGERHTNSWYAMPFTHLRWYSMDEGKEDIEKDENGENRNIPSSITSIDFTSLSRKDEKGIEPKGGKRERKKE